MAVQTTVFGEDPSTLAALVYTTSVTMDPNSFCGVFGKSSSMSCGKSAFCSYDTDLGLAGCCAVETFFSRIVCPFEPTCIDHDNLPPGMSLPYTDWDPKEGLSCYGGNGRATCQTYSWTDFGAGLKSFSCGLSAETFTVGFPGTFASYLKTEVLHMTDATTETTSASPTAKSRPSSLTAPVTAYRSSATRASTITSTATTVAPSNATATETTSTSTSTSSGVSAPIIGTVSSIAALFLAIILAWFLDKRKRRSEERQLEEASKHAQVQPAIYASPDESLPPAPLTKHHARLTSELETQTPKQTQERQVHELDHHVPMLTDNRHASWAPSELHGSMQTGVLRQRLPSVSSDPIQDCEEPSQGLAQVKYQPYVAFRESQVPDGVAELPA